MFLALITHATKKSFLFGRDGSHPNKERILNLDLPPPRDVDYDVVLIDSHVDAMDVPGVTRLNKNLCIIGCSVLDVVCTIIALPPHALRPWSNLFVSIAELIRLIRRRRRGIGRVIGRGISRSRDGRRHPQGSDQKK